MAVAATVAEGAVASVAVAVTTVGEVVALEVADGAVVAVAVAGAVGGGSVACCCVQATTSIARTRMAAASLMRRIIEGVRRKVKPAALVPRRARVVDTRLGWT